MRSLDLPNDDHLSAIFKEILDKFGGFSINNIKLLENKIIQPRISSFLGCFCFTHSSKNSILLT